MKTLHILVVSRNRIAGLIDALASIKRFAALLKDSSLNVEVTIQDNSDCNVSTSVLRYFGKFISINYYKTASLLSMSMNWNEGLKHVISHQPDYVAVLADRRLLSANLFNAVKHLEDMSLPFICFDHQNVWLNAHRITKGRHTYSYQTVNRYNLLAAISSAQIDWHYPMLFNCLITSQFMTELQERYGSFASGSSPDMNFLARTADIGIDNYVIYDAPCIVTNARHASTSNGTSSTMHGIIQNTEHIRLSGIESYPFYMDNFITANIIGSLLPYWSEGKIRKFLNPLGFFNSSLLELSYPKSLASYTVMKDSLLKYVREFALGPDAAQLVNNINHNTPESQTYPIAANSCLSNSPDLELLELIE